VLSKLVWARDSGSELQLRDVALLLAGAGGADCGTGALIVTNSRRSSGSNPAINGPQPRSFPWGRPARHLSQEVSVNVLPRLLAALAAVLLPAAPVQAQTAPPVLVQRAVFAGGCFWCVEAAFEGIPGVLDVVSGFSGGTLANPSYERVTAGGTGHAEVVQVTYDPGKTRYQTLLEIFWRNIDPLDAGGQFCDRGASYRAEIFVADAAERQLAEASKAALEQRFGKPIATRISAAAPFYPAEGYHQDYHARNPLRYKLYRTSCGRDARLDALWGKEARGR
jgi:peptide-methionine (S)-S-oxide reductase